ncbi:MAG TPA: PIN domain-containing protein [Dongiaceae bacterium]|nr:PIN domain-containing protein [Dongiaceae bacterium]
MSRATHEVSPSSKPDPAANTSNRAGSRNAHVWLFRCFLIAALATIALSLSPFGAHRWAAAAIGGALAALIFAAEHSLRRASAATVLGGAIGGLLGGVAALLVTFVVSHTSETESAKSFIEYASLVGFGYTGIMLGAQKAPAISTGPLRTLFVGASAVERGGAGHDPRDEGKLLDTSVLIDGRIADICEANFLDGPLLVPQFVLHELQMVADSSDTLRRQRGRRGLEVLQRMQKLQTIEVRVIDDDPAHAGEVDRKLVELAQRLKAKIVTNDFNLNKVASVQGIGVLNVNLLANALRPAVLPGESMSVFILREGKEVNQGVAYLEDGTMVVVDGARRLINKTVDIVVTSVHQTPAGKMIFGRLDERGETHAGVRTAPVGRGERYSEPQH